MASCASQPWAVVCRVGEHHHACVGDEAVQGPLHAWQKRVDRGQVGGSRATARVSGNFVSSGLAAAGSRVAMVTWAPAPASARTVSDAQARRSHR